MSTVSLPSRMQLSNCMFSFGLLHFISAPVGLELVAGSFTVVSVFESPFNLFNPSSTFFDTLSIFFNALLSQPCADASGAHIDNIINDRMMMFFLFISSW